MSTAKGSAERPAEEAWQRVDRFVQPFEEAWQAGRRPALDRYLPEGGPDRLAVLRELLHVDLERRQTAGDDARVEEYLQRYPELHACREAVLELIVAEHALRQLQDPARTPAAFLRRFPDYQEELIGRLGPAPAAGNAEPCSAADAPTLVPVTPAGPGAASEVPAIAGYEVLGELGRGGMGVVYQARQAGLNRLVALKMILAGAQAGPDDVARFKAEAEAVARLQHPGIVQIHEVGDHAGLPFFSLEFVPGGSLAQRLRGTPLPARQAAALIARLAWAVHAAHQAGIVHRDLKPANVLLQEGPDVPVGECTPKLTDFGLAKQLDSEHGRTRSGALLGTPNYMAPEQAGGKVKAIGPATDVYALGAILYECLTGRPPFTAETPLDTVLQVLTDEPVPPGRLVPKLPRDLETICLKCLQKDPRQRYATAETLADDLCRFGKGEPIRARPISHGERALKWARRRPAAAGLIGLGAVTLAALAALIAGLFYGARLEAERNEAENQRGRAEAARLEADLAKGEVERQRDLVRRTGYAAHTSLAMSAWRDADISQMLLLLNEQRPERTGGKDLRGFEWYYLRGLGHSDLLTLHGHVGVSRGVRFSPDGRSVAAAAQEHAVKLWDASTGQEIRTLRGHADDVEDVAFSPDGLRLATASDDGTIKVWDAHTSQVIHTLKAHVRRVCFSPDGFRLASASKDRTACVWDAQTGQNLLTVKGHRAAVSGVAFSPDGLRLATASDDGTARVWDVATGRQIHLLRGHTGVVEDVLFSPDGLRLVTASEDRAVKVWDAATGQPALTLRGHTAGVMSVAFSSDGRRLASVGWDRTVRVWDAQTGQEVRTLKGHTDVVAGVAFDPDGTRLASASADETVKVWDATTDQEARTFYGHKAGVSGVAFSPDGLRLATASADGTVRVWDARTGQSVHTLKGHTRPVQGVAYDPDGTRLASASADGTVKVWDAQTGQEARTFKGHTATVFGVAFSPDGRRVASASADGTAKVWDTATGQEIQTLRGHTAPVEGVCFSPDGLRLATASWDNTAKVWDAAAGQEIFTFRWGHAPVDSVCFSPDSKHLATASQDWMVKVWDAQTGREEFTLRGHTQPLQCVCYSPDGRRLASASADRTVKVWDAATGQATLTLRGHTDIVVGVCWSPDGRRLGSASADKTVKVWDAGPGYRGEE
jgi:WD40 repeat protein